MHELGRLISKMKFFSFHQTMGNFSWSDHSYQSDNDRFYSPFRQTRVSIMSSHKYSLPSSVRGIVSIYKRHVNLRSAFQCIIEFFFVEHQHVLCPFVFHLQTRIKFTHTNESILTNLSIFFLLVISKVNTESDMFFCSSKDHHGTRRRQSDLPVCHRAGR